MDPAIRRGHRILARGRRLRTDWRYIYLIIPLFDKNKALHEAPLTGGHLPAAVLPAHPPPSGSVQRGMRQGRQAVDAMWRLREVWDRDGGDLAAGGDMASKWTGGGLKVGIRHPVNSDTPILAGVRCAGGAGCPGAAIRRRAAGRLARNARPFVCG